MKPPPISLLSLLLGTTTALFRDEAGIDDFTISTAGHGLYGVTHAFLHTSSPSSSVLTFSRNDCYLSSRSISNNGTLQWRRNVCSTNLFGSEEDKGRTTAVHYEPELGTVYTVDGTGLLRWWNDGDGSLRGEIPGLFFSAEESGGSSSSVSSLEFRRRDGGDEAVVVLDIVRNGTIVTSRALGDPTQSLPLPSSSSSKRINTREPETEGSLPPSVTCDDSTLSISSLQDNPQLSIRRTNEPKQTTTIVTSVPLFAKGDDTPRHIHLLSCHPSSSRAVLLVTTWGGRSIATTVHWGNNQQATATATVHWIHEEAMGNLASATFLDVHEEDGGGGGGGGGEAASDDNEDWETVVGRLGVWSRLRIQTEDIGGLVRGGLVKRLGMLWNPNGGSVVVGGSGGSGGSAVSSREYGFGLVKVAVLLSTRHLGRLMGIDASRNRGGVGGRLVWTVPLNRNKAWHKVVHGSASGKSSVFGLGMHHPRSHELLVLSHPELETTNDTELEWRCVDGIRGSVLAEGSVRLTSDVVKVLPIHVPGGGGDTHGGCRQIAVLVHGDDTVTVVPDTAEGRKEVDGAVEQGLYAHTIDEESGTFRSVRIVPLEEGGGSDEGVWKVLTVGVTGFDPDTERIRGVTYPQRNEVVQSPTTIVGDDSLLLKYLNPHLCVVVTEATEAFVDDVVGRGSGEGDETETKEMTEGGKFYRANNGETNKASTKTAVKPLGANKPGEDAASATSTKSPVPVTTVTAPVPTLFINVMDTVSGRILYRISHAHLPPSTSSAPSSSHVPVVISENWIVYAFPNAATRRTEIGVLTLHEGMIDKHGISMFVSPTQSTTFSSFSNPKPIVLHKTFGFPRSVSALGVTNTRGGISSKSVLLATGVGGQVVRVDRRMLDPRRPAGVPKVTEKKEGLLQYQHLIPISPLHTPSYTNVVANVKSIVSTAANLESQTLVLSYGGPDVFYTQFAPSKGFDSLPASFNKLLLVMVMFGLFVALIKAKSMSGKKAVQFGWS